jgi:hypothetical protein
MTTWRTCRIHPACVTETDSRGDVFHNPAQSQPDSPAEQEAVYYQARVRAAYSREFRAETKAKRRVQRRKAWRFFFQTLGRPTPLPITSGERTPTELEHAERIKLEYAEQIREEGEPRTEEVEDTLSTYRDWIGK